MPTKGEQESVSVTFFCEVEKALRRQYRGKDVRVDQETLNRWIRLLGRVEREYVKLAKKGRSKT